MRDSLTISLLSVVALLAACGSPDATDVLPAAFRIEAEIVSVEGLGAGSCTPTTADIDPDGPDWELLFERVHDPIEPTFREWNPSSSGDSAARCSRDGDDDCCRPLAAAGGGWMLECEGEGEDDGLPYTTSFVFDFADDGTGTATTTITITASGVVACATRVEWSALLPI